VAGAASRRKRCIEKHSGLKETVQGKEYPSTLTSMNNPMEVLELHPIDILL
jgi:hypothetical protein